LLGDLACPAGSFVNLGVFQGSGIRYQASDAF